MTQYKRAPITEAVIEIRFEKPLPKQTVDKLNERLKDDYVSSDPLSTIGVQFDLQQKQATVDASDSGYKLTSKDQADILLITPASMACSRLAPYNGWEAFRARAEDSWKKWKRLSGYQKIQGLGVRYINRIDIPHAGEEKIRVEDFLNVYPEYPEPELFPALNKYTMQIVGFIGLENFNLVINSGIMSSPLVEHLSVMLDLDVRLIRDVPQKDDKIWAMFDLMREHKNHVFETCITDDARKLFQK